MVNHNPKHKFRNTSDFPISLILKGFIFIGLILGIIAFVLVSTAKCKDEYRSLGASSFPTCVPGHELDLKKCTCGGLWPPLCPDDSVLDMNKCQCDQLSTRPPGATSKLLPLLGSSPPLGPRAPCDRDSDCPIAASGKAFDAELDLGKHILRYAEAIESAAAECRPNYLTTYLYELSQKFSTFYNDCPVLIAEEDKRPTRLLLCKLTEKTVQHGLTKLLGIDVVEKM